MDDLHRRAARRRYDVDPAAVAAAILDRLAAGGALLGPGEPAGHGGRGT